MLAGGRRVSNHEAARAVLSFETAYASQAGLRMPPQDEDGIRSETTMQDYARALWRWLGRTPVVTFILCPLAVIAFELALHGGWLTFVPWGVPLMAWGYLQYLLVGRYRHPRAGGTA